VALSHCCIYQVAAEPGFPKGAGYRRKGGHIWRAAVPHLSNRHMIQPQSSPVGTLATTSHLPLSEMDTLTPEQAQALWDAGGFLILSDLPEGSEFGIDGT